MADNLNYSELSGLASVGGYENTVRLTELSSVFLLSACAYLKNRDIWQSQLMKISDAEYENILEMIAQAESDLMSTYAIGSIFPSIALLADNDNVILMDGSTIDGNNYPELLAIVPAAWLSGTDIILPDMSQKGVFGENGNVGDIVGENTVQLSESEMPIHTHTQNPHSHSEIIPIVTPTAAGEIPTAASLVTPSGSTTGLTTATNNNAGGDSPHNNIQESLSVYWYIIGR